MNENQFVELMANHLASVVQRLDSAFHRTNLYPVDIAISFPNGYPLDSDLSGGQEFKSNARFLCGKFACVKTVLFCSASALEREIKLQYDSIF